MNFSAKGEKGQAQYKNPLTVRKRRPGVGVLGGWQKEWPAGSRKTS